MQAAYLLSGTQNCFRCVNYQWKNEIDFSKTLKTGVGLHLFLIIFDRIKTCFYLRRSQQVNKWCISSHSYSSSSGQFLVWGLRAVITIKAIIVEVLYHNGDQCDHLWPSCDHVWPTCDLEWTDVIRLHRAIITIKELIFEFLDLDNDQCDQLWPGVTTCDQLCPNNHQGLTYLAMSRPQVHLMGFPSCYHLL